MEHYLDNAATTRVIGPAAEKAVDVMTALYGNPSSVHSMGALAEKELETARARVLKALGAGEGQLVFTSGGTEAINTALIGACRKYGKKNKRIVSTMVEHAATLETLKFLSDEGFDVRLIKPGRDGGVSARDIVAEAQDACLVTLMAINNETGAVLPVSEVKALLRDAGSGALLHVDGVQAFLKTEEPLASFGADFLSVSGHKVGAPKGVGALFIKKGVRIPPLLHGGGQENGMRSGTEAMSAIASLGEVCALYSQSLDEKIRKIQKLNAYARRRLKDEIPGLIFNSPEDASGYILNISLPGAKSEVLMRVLQGRGVFVSSGSACAKGHRSHVLSAMNLDHRLIDSAIRVSFCPENTGDDIDALCAGLKEGAKLFDM